MALQTHHHHKVLINFSIITEQGCCFVVSERKTQPKPPTTHCKEADFQRDLKPASTAERACRHSQTPTHADAAGPHLQAQA